MSLIFWGRNLLIIIWPQKSTRNLFASAEVCQVSFCHIIVSKLSSLKQPSIINCSCLWVIWQLMWPRLRWSGWAWLTWLWLVRELCSSLGLFEALDPVQICSKSPQSSTGINRLALLAHPSHGDDKKARRNVVGPLESRSRIRTWLLSLYKILWVKANHLAESRVKGLENMLHLFQEELQSQACKEYEDISKGKESG